MRAAPRCNGCGPPRGQIVLETKVKAEMPNKPVITIVDDDEFVRTALMSLMRALGFVSEAYRCAEDFLKSGRLHRTSCLIADVRMPGMTGLELHRHLVASGHPIPTVLITAHSRRGGPGERAAGRGDLLPGQAVRRGRSARLHPFGPRTPQARWEGLMITAGSTVHQHLLGANGLPSVTSRRPAQTARVTTRWPRPQIGRPPRPSSRSRSARSGFSRHDGSCWKPTRPVRLGSRALEILIALVERPGELVSKNELMARVWPSTFVEEGNLKVQVAGLRRALGDSRGSNRYLATVPGRGYRFVAPVSRADQQVSPPRRPPPRERMVCPPP